MKRALTFYVQVTKQLYVWFGFHKYFRCFCWFSVDVFLAFASCSYYT